MNELTKLTRYSICSIPQAENPDVARLWVTVHLPIKEADILPKERAIKSAMIDIKVIHRLNHVQLEMFSRDGDIINIPIADGDMIWKLTSITRYIRDGDINLDLTGWLFKNTREMDEDIKFIKPFSKWQENPRYSTRVSYWYHFMLYAKSLSGYGYHYPETEGALLTENADNGKHAVT